MYEIRFICLKISKLFVFLFYTELIFSNPVFFVFYV